MELFNTGKAGSPQIAATLSKVKRTGPKHANESDRNQVDGHNEVQALRHKQYKNAELAEFEEVLKEGSNVAPAADSNAPAAPAKTKKKA